MKLAISPKELTYVPFSKTECGVDFNLNTDTHQRLRGVLMEYPCFKTNFFELFFFRKASGWLRYGFQHIALKDNTVLILSLLIVCFIATKQISHPICWLLL